MLAISALALVDDDWYKGVRPKLKARFLEELEGSGLTQEKKATSVDNQLKLLYGILSSPLQGDYTFFNLLGMGSYGIVFEGKNEKEDLISIKVMFESNNKYSNCVEAYEWVKQLRANPKVKFIINIQKPNYFDKYSQFACSMLMDRGYATDQPFFSAGERSKDNTANTLKMVKFFVQLLESFSTINHEGGFYHGDVKPENTLFIKTADGFEPRIIDFDLMFKKIGPHYNPGNIIYTLTYRPPELTRIVPRTNPSSTEKVALRKYKYDADFREEAWSVGKTIAKIVDINRTFLDAENPKLVALLAIVREMTSSDIKNRICTEVAWQKAADILASSKEII